MKSGISKGGFIESFISLIAAIHSSKLPKALVLPYGKDIDCRIKVNTSSERPTELANQDETTLQVMPLVYI